MLKQVQHDGGGRIGEGLRSTLSRTAFALLFSAIFATAIGNLALISVMPAIGRALRIPDFLVACIFSFSALVWAMTSPFWGRQSDRHGRKPMLLIGTAGFAGSMAGCGLVVMAGLATPIAPIAIFLVFAAVRSTYGLFGSAAATAAQAYIADRTTGAERVRRLSTLAGALSLGTIVGPAIAPLLILPPFGLAGPMIGFAVAGLVLLAAIAIGLPRDIPHAPASPRDAPKPASLWRDDTLRPFLIYGLVVASMQAINTYTLGFAVIDALGVAPIAAQSRIGAAMALGAAASLIGQVGLVPILKLGPEAMLRWGAGLACAGNLLIVLHGGYLTLLIGFPLACLGYGLARPGFAAAASIAVGGERQGAVAGAVSSIAGASITLPPIIAVACYQLWWGAPFLIAAIGLGAVAVYAVASPAMRLRPNVS